MVRCFLASRGLGALPAFLGGAGGGARGVWVPTAANRLTDRVGVLAGAARDLAGAGLAPRVVDLDAPPPEGLAAALASAEVIVVTGGDPFYLMHRLVAGEGADAITRAVARGARYVGVSAGAIVAGPTLEAHTLTSPATPRPGQALAGLGLVDPVIFPHHDAPGRAARHAEAVRVLGARLTLVPLADDEALVVEDGQARLVASPDLSGLSGRGA